MNTFKVSLNRLQYLFATLLILSAVAVFQIYGTQSSFFNTYPVSFLAIDFILFLITYLVMQARVRNICRGRKVVKATLISLYLVMWIPSILGYINVEDKLIEQTDTILTYSVASIMVILNLYLQFSKGIDSRLKPHKKNQKSRRGQRLKHYKNVA